MKNLFLFARASLLVLVLLGALPRLHAEITVRLSVKFLLGPGGMYPTDGIGTNAGFQAEVDRGNAVLASTGRGYKLQVVDYLGIEPPVPAGSNANYWFTLDARANRSTFESTALASPFIWRWNTTALNIYVNNTSSGQCSFVAGGSSISLGKTVGVGTVLHEIGHFFNLRHTHTNDYTDNTSPAVYGPGDLVDGDSLAETANDNPNMTNNYQMCIALFNKAYTNATAGQRAIVDSAFENVMSYHNENVLLTGQMDIWGQNGNASRLYVCTGRTWFAANGGSDGASGNQAATPFATLSKSLSVVTGSDDVILLRSGSYLAPVGGTLSTPCLIGATRGGVFITKP